MNKTSVQVQVYDWPVRFFHWLFAGLFVAAYFIAQVFEDDSAQYPYHMLLGLTLALTVLLRITWGFAGSRFARFHSFELHPKQLLAYMKSLLQKPGKIFLGHNPASSWAAIVMMICALGLATSGYFMIHGHKEDLEEVHELFANLFLFTAIAHVAGVVFHTIKHKDPIGLAMINGKKFWSESVPGIQRTFLIGGLLFVIVTVGFGIHLFNNYDRNTMALTVFGQTHQLGKVEKE
jgi:cytochrome b